MTRKVHVALARVYASASSYGKTPFTGPTGSPMRLTSDGWSLSVHFGSAPNWLLLAEGRAPILGEAMLRASFQNDPAGLRDFNNRVSTAQPASLPRPGHRWMVTLLVTTSAEWPDEDDGSPWLWFRSKSLSATLRSMEARASSIDLAAQVLKQFMANVLTDTVVRDRVYLARNETLEDAVAVPQFTMGIPTVSTTMDLDQLEAAIAGPDLRRALENVISVPAIPPEPGRSEALREIQVRLMWATPDQPVVVLYIDMNGLKNLNDTHGHDAGDAAIEEFENAVREVHKGSFFRIGGDEFLLLDQASATQGAELGRRLLRSVASRSVRGATLSASVGIVTASDPKEAPKRIRDRADQEMYRAKDASKREPGKLTCVLVVENCEAEVVQ